jgi:hypothetical protein
MDDKAIASPFGLVVEIKGGDDVISPSSEIFFACEQKSEYAFLACHGVGKNPNWSKGECNRASEELRRCLQANVDVIKALREDAQWRTTKLGQDLNPPCRTSSSRT